ncbi:hypothetical protein [Luteimonas sp. 3794]|uniref:hypothetical protein n=1 Tax=Luteimonas sp. 3794 TaxID=2817730 RepID=UPI00285D8B38|nr:hypothetical protein [Luteimonas sp. 3794]MDR6992710.1 hypothetical protein [Luteimonas sp. 3794]
MSDKHTPDTTRGPLEQARTPDGPKAPGESSEKRDQDQRNDPESMPGALEGNPTRQSGEGTPGNPGHRNRD